MLGNHNLNGLNIHENKQEDSDIVVIKDTKNIDEFVKKGFFYIPNKITYRREIPSSVDDLLKSLKKNKRKKIKKSLKKCSEIKFVRVKELDWKMYNEWLKVYKQMIGAKKHGNILATTEWFDKHKKKRYAVFALKDGKVVGGIIGKILIHDKETLSVSFSAYDKKFSSDGLNEVLNVEMMEFAREFGLKYINRGIDTNLYGYHLSVGMYLFKKSLGFYPTANER
jgi:lipid II:glycine glycyltransferase (peptidoglycan interpeptide bridge formation enzyme)